MTTPGWLIHLIARWRSAASGSARADLHTLPQEIDIDLSDSEAAASDESTDYDVHSLGDPIDPPAVARRAER